MNAFFHQARRHLGNYRAELQLIAIGALPRYRDGVDVLPVIHREIDKWTKIVESVRY